jgi:hypothetical protein
MRRDGRARKRERHSPHPYLLLFAPRSSANETWCLDANETVAAVN